MGLDMYLSKKTYVKNWDFQKKEEKFSVSVKKNGKKYQPIKPERISYIIESVMYWRKANHIHKWFVDNVQDGVDECQESYVSTDKLKELLDTCKKVEASLLNSKKKIFTIKTLSNENEEIEGFADISVAEELLPTQGGFFFGSVIYDEYYLEDVQNTIKSISSLLEEDSESAEFYYQSSW